jgi:FMN phosphatase YigB (HAD superfamily)
LKKHKAVLFDLDGTLLPMNLELFMQKYFQLLSEELAPFGFESRELIAVVWKGTRAMMENDGSRTNEDRFWEIFGPYARELLPDIRNRLDSFYRGRFQRAKETVEENPLAARAVRAAREKVGKVVLATNPLFPVSAVETRLSWIGLKIQDFDMVTTYEVSRACKPNPVYFQEILRKIGVSPDQALMVGNDVQEDMTGCAALSMPVFLVRDCMITHGLDDTPYRGGNFHDLLAFLEGEKA